MAIHSSTLAWRIPWMEEAGKVTVHGVTKSQTWLSDFTFTFHFHALEKEMATHSSVLVWRTPGTGKPGDLLSMESHRVGHDGSDLAAATTAHICLKCWEKKFQKDWVTWKVKGHGSVAQVVKKRHFHVSFKNYLIFLESQNVMYLSILIFKMSVDKGVT